MKMFVLCITLLVFGTLTFAGQAVKPVNTKDGIAIRGYDMVAYFNNSKAIKGSDEFQHEWNDAKWYFSSASNRDLFAKAPEKYAPQFGGYCAYAASRDYIYDADPQFWRIVDGRLYL